MVEKSQEHLPSLQQTPEVRSELGSDILSLGFACLLSIITGIVQAFDIIGLNDTWQNILYPAFWAFLIGLFLAILYRLGQTMRTVSGAERQALVSARLMIEETKRLSGDFRKLASRDNIIAPLDGEHRVISVRKIDRIPDAIEVVWKKAFKNEHEYSPSKMIGLASLWAPSIDDMINTFEYVEYLFSNTDEDLRRILFVPKPKGEQNTVYWEGLKIFAELNSKAGAKLYILDQDAFQRRLAEIRSRKTFLTEADVAFQDRVLLLLVGNFEFWTDGPLDDLDSQNWLARWVDVKKGGVFGVAAPSLAEDGDPIISQHSRESDEDEMKPIILAAAQMLRTIAEECIAAEESGQGKTAFDKKIKNSVINSIASLRVSEEQPKEPKAWHKIVDKLKLARSARPKRAG